MIYLVTGASSGIGYAIAQELLDQNCSVIGVSRHINPKITLLMQNHPKTYRHEIRDLSVEIDLLSEWVRNLSSTHGKFAGLVHSAGIQQILPLRSINYDTMLNVFNINVFAALSLAKGIADRRSNIGEGTSIVFLSSIASTTGSSGIITYSASKAALNGAMRSMSRELAPQKIRVNSVLPGFIETEMIEKWKDVYDNEYIDKIREVYPLALGTPKDVAAMVIFLLTNKSKWITGCEFNVSGGATLGI
ncbi:MAG: SDR family NAD(P)-dependent oxidoreductase [Cylindrospermopsis raciborskii]|uniref:SDR family NAD(P)-dependent oxidoreductase n=1 Tax=Cylindrospermopsis raciborskii TaxID=77022 RepID=UPI003D0C72AC